MALSDVDALIKSGVQAAQAGDKKAAKELFVRALKQNPRSELAWMWMVSVVETEKERRFCLQKILEINPNNQRARQALAQMQQADLPDWLREAASPQPPQVAKPQPSLSARFAPTPPPAAPTGAPPRLELDFGEATEEKTAPAEDWSAWPEPEFEGVEPAADTGVEALRAEAAAEKKPERGRRRLRIILLLLLIVALSALAAVIIIRRPFGGGAAAATHTPTLTATSAPTETARPTETRTPTVAVTATRTPTRTPEPTARPDVPSDALRTPAGEPPEGGTPPTEETIGSGVEPVLTAEYAGQGYTLAYPDAWVVTVNEEPETLTEVTLSHGSVDVNAKPLPDEFAFATIDTSPAEGRTAEELLAGSRAAALSLSESPGIEEVGASGATTIGGEAGLFEYYTVPVGPDRDVYVYAAAVVADDRGFVFMLFSTAEADRATAQAILKSVVFEDAQ